MNEAAKLRAVVQMVIQKETKASKMSLKKIDGTVSDNGVEEDVGRGNVACSVNICKDLAKMSKALGIILKLGIQKATEPAL